VGTLILCTALAETVKLAWSVHSINVHCCTALLKGFKMKAYKHLVKFALKAGHTVSVYDGEVWEVRRSTEYKAIIYCIESVEIASLRIRNSEGEIVGWASVIPFGLEDDETVADNTITEFMTTWEESYNSKV